GFDASFTPGKAQAVWQIKDGKPTKLAGGADLGGPNGLLVVGDDLWVVNAVGEIYKLGQGGKRESVEKLARAGLDGVVAGADGTFYVTSWEGSSVLHGKPGAFIEGPTGLTTPADLAIDTK